MTENANLLWTAADAPPEGDPHRFRSSFVEPTPTPAPFTTPTPQELHPVSQTVLPEARESIAPRPASIPTHRADVPAPTVVENDVADSRPASAPRHSVATSAITIPVFAVPVGPDLPQPPERVTLDDDVLARLVTRRFDDTATVDLMAVVQAQMLARRAEAARFARWENEISRVGTDEAALVLERTRLRFTGVIDVIGGGAGAAGAPGAAAPVAPDLDDSDTNLIPIVTPEEVAADLAARQETARIAERERLAAGSTGETAAAAVSTGSAPAVVPSPVVGTSDVAPSDVAPTSDVASTDAVASTGAVASTSDTAPSSDTPAVAPSAAGEGRLATLRASITRANPVLTISAGAVVVVVALTLVLALVAGESLGTAVVATLAVPLIGALAAFVGVVAVSRRAGDAGLVDRRGPIAVVAAVVIAAVLGFGILSPVAAALGWQGYLVSGVGASGPAAGVAVVLALLVAAVSALVVAVLLTGVRRSARD
ncbi:hypothetical protein FRIG_10235 [Frigoribacterium faeni]|uniref:hypothetical protein n=1 Tax=Frigoribacterium faeni TaxID=145483 RepID=UPI001FAE1988|nr:hypothetical protein [Frigoribacterium faeni]MCJ0701505.1 hypothetical protein [Frigoribacterium faeni]